MVHVLITTSGTGSRLEHLTTATNKSLLPIGDKYAICHIIDSYPEDTEFIITLGYFGDHVRDFLILAYPNRKISFVNVDKYKGAGSSLGYSMLQAKEQLNCPFIFHCCDTIIDSINVDKLTTNTLFVIKNDDYMSYSSVNVKENKVIQINDKGFKENDYIYTGLSYIKDYEIFWQIMDKLYAEAPNNMTLSDIHSIAVMIKQDIDFSYSILDLYYDTGNLKSYADTCNHFSSKFNVLAKSTESLCFLDNRVIKFVSDKEINQKRIVRGQNLRPYVPTILDTKSNFISMAFIKGELLADCTQYDEISNLLEWAQNNLWSEKSIDEKYIQCCMNFYRAKTYERISKLPFLDNEIHTINGLEVGSIATLLDSFDFTTIATNTFAKFHGDFILDNILKLGESSYCLLDWRHEFDTELYYGDVYYDLAKLRHNIIINHSNVLHDLYDITYNSLNDKRKVFVDIKCNYMLMRQLDEYNHFIAKYDYNRKKIDILTAIIWVNMAPLYEGKLREFLFYFGKFHLYLAIRNYVRP